MVNLNFVWEHKEEKDGNIKTHYLNIPVKVVNSYDSDYGYHGTLICNKCNSRVDQFYICQSCSDKAKIGEITRRFDEKENLIYEEQQKTAFMQNEVDKTVKVVDELNADVNLLRKVERFEKTYEMYTNDSKVSPVILKIYKFLMRENKALVVTFGYSNRGKSNDLGGLIIAGDNKLTLIQLRDYRLIRQTKQEGMELTVRDSQLDQTTDLLNNISESKYPEKMDKFFEKIKNGEKIEVVEVREKPKIEVEASFLD